MRVAAAAACGAVALITGCGAASNASATGSAKSLTPRQAVTLASDTTTHATSLTGQYSVHAGTTAAEITTGTVSVQLKPVFLASENITVLAAGRKLPISEIITDKALYLKEPALSAQTGKRWAEILVSHLSGGSGNTLAQLFQSAQNGNPLEQTQMLAAAQDVRAAGTQVVGGVQTTHYTGSFAPRAAVSALSPSLRNSVAPMLNLLSGDIEFNVWIDSQHQVRKIIETETVSGQPVTVTMAITSIDQPVRITLPAASQVAIMPGGDLSGL